MQMKILESKCFIYRYMKTVDEVRNTEEILRRLLSYRDLFKLLSEKTGLNITTTYMAYELYNQLVAKVRAIIYYNLRL